MKLCKCECGEEIIITKNHKINGIPSFLHGHNGKGILRSEKTRQKISLANKGRILSIKTRQKISLSLLGNKYTSKKTRNKLSIAQKGKKHSEETRRKISESKMGFKHAEETKRKLSKYIGEKASNWQGGISFEPYTHHFNNSLKKKIRKRDDNLCQLCGKTEKENKRKLPIHHIDYVKENCNDENLLSLCTSCNGKVNFNRGFWTGFFVGYIISRNKFV